MQKSFIALLFLALITVACGGGEDAPSEAPATAKTEKKDINVKKIWKVRCIACHGIDGTMGNQRSGQLAGE